MKFHDVYHTHHDAPDLLYRLLREREPHQSISHINMPTMEQHLAFIASKPYLAWYLIDAGDLVGATYLTQRREVGIGILRKFWRHGYGKGAVQMLRDKHPGPLLANISPGNRPSMELFVDLGFRHIQNTFLLSCNHLGSQGDLA